MGNLVARTALPGRSRSSHDELARALGYFSIALGLAEIAMPRAMSRAVGLDGYETLVRLYGAREIATGLAILTSHDATPWVWGRVAGDAADIGTVAAGADDPKGPRTLLSLAALAGVTAVDVVCAIGLANEKGGPRTAIADYSDRSGFRGGVEAARGAARNKVRPRQEATRDAPRHPA